MPAAPSLLCLPADLRGTNVNLVERDDRGKNGKDQGECKRSTSMGDCYYFDQANMEGYISQLWASCCTDGTVIGPLPVNRTWRFNIRFDVVKNIDHFQIGDFNPTTNQMNFLSLDKDEVFQKGIEVSAFTCTDYCAEKTCGQCTVDPQCGWCSGSGGGCRAIEDAVRHKQACMRAALLLFFAAAHSACILVVHLQWHIPTRRLLLVLCHPRPLQRVCQRP